jgi:hypothetical protein
LCKQPSHNQPAWSENRDVQLPDTRNIVDSFKVHEVLGGHVSMTKEPNIRILASKLNRCLDDAELITQYNFKYGMNQALEEKGYIIVDLLNQDEVQKLINLYLINFSSNRSSGYFSSNAPSIALSDRLLVNQEIRKIFEPKLISLFPDYMVLTCLFLSKKPDQSNSEKLLHQDPSIVNETFRKSFQVWCPLIDVDQSNGCLQVIPKSHLLNSKPRHQFAFSVFPYSQNILSLMKHRYLSSEPMKAGQALIYDRRLFHGSYPNSTNIERLAIVCLLAPKNKPLHFCYQEVSSSDKIEIFEI